MDDHPRRWYDIRSQIAQGGMAQVWLATLKGPDGFRKDVVLKTILPTLAEEPAFVQMFIDEARIAAHLNHPNIVQILDFGKSRGQYFITMEYVRGRTLRQLARDCRETGNLIPPWVVLRTLATACEALQYAHDLVDEHEQPLGLVHRDVTPENIMLSFMGEVKLLDFGVARANFAASESKAGGLKGKYAYISPELIQGGQADRRSDVYAMGVVLYELLTGHRPFRGANELALLKQVLDGRFRRPRERAPWIPEELEQIILNAMQADPERRYREIARMAADLETVLRLAHDRHTHMDLATFLSKVYPEAQAGTDVRKLASGTLSLSPVTPAGSLSAFMEVAEAHPPRNPIAPNTDEMETHNHQAMQAEIVPTGAKQPLQAKAPATNNTSVPAQGWSSPKRRARSRVRLTAPNNAPTLEPLPSQDAFRRASLSPTPRSRPLDVQTEEISVSSVAARYFESGLEALTDGRLMDALAAWEFATILSPNDSDYLKHFERLKKRVQTEEDRKS